MRSDFRIDLSTAVRSAIKRGKNQLLSFLKKIEIMAEVQYDGSLMIRISWFNVGNVTTGDVEELFQGTCVWSSEYMKTKVIVLSFQHKDDVVKHLDHGNRKFRETEFIVRPEICKCMTAEINELWVRQMRKEHGGEFDRILADSCKQCAVSTSNGQYRITGSMESVEDALKALQRADSGLNNKAEVGESSLGNTDDDFDMLDEVEVPSGSAANISSENASGSGRRNRQLKNLSQPKQNDQNRSVSSPNDVNSRNESSQQTAVTAPRNRILKAEMDREQPQHPYPLGSNPLPSAESEKCGKVAILESKYNLILQNKPDFLRMLADKSIRWSTESCGDSHVLKFQHEDVRYIREIEKTLTRYASEVLSRSFSIVAIDADWDDIVAIAGTNDRRDVTLQLDRQTKRCTIYGYDQQRMMSTIMWFNKMLNDYKKGLIEYSSGDGKDISKQNIGSDFCGKKSSSKFSTISKELGDELSVTTSSGLEVLIKAGDMLKQPTVVIVNSANDQLAHGGGLARAIVMAGGSVIETESRDIISRQGPVQPGEVVHTTSGNLPPPIKYVVHAVPPSQHQLSSGNQGEDKLEQAFFRSMQYSNDKLQAESLSIPPFGAGIFSVPIDVVMAAFVNALKRFDQEMGMSGKQKYVKYVHFVSNDRSLVRDMIKSFKALTQ